MSSIASAMQFRKLVTLRAIIIEPSLKRKYLDKIYKSVKNGKNAVYQSLQAMEDALNQKIALNEQLDHLSDENDIEGLNEVLFDASNIALICNLAEAFNKPPELFATIGEHMIEINYVDTEDEESESVEESEEDDEPSQEEDTSQNTPIMDEKQDESEAKQEIESSPSPSPPHVHDTTETVQTEVPQPPQTNAPDEQQNGMIKHNNIASDNEHHTGQGQEEHEDHESTDPYAQYDEESSENNAPHIEEQEKTRRSRALLSSASSPSKTSSSYTDTDSVYSTTESQSHDSDHDMPKKSTKKKKKKKKTKHKRRQESEVPTYNVEYEDTLFTHAHEKLGRKQTADSKKWDRDWDKIHKSREEIKRIKKKKKLQKQESENMLALRNQNRASTNKVLFTSAHEKNVSLKPHKGKFEPDWDKIKKQREEIRRIKAKNKKKKQKEANSLKTRNKDRNKTAKVFKSGHEKDASLKPHKSKYEPNWDKIKKQREEIKRIKEKRKKEKEDRAKGSARKRTTSFKHAHDCY
eukprot:216264_1